MAKRKRYSKSIHIEARIFHVYESATNDERSEGLLWYERAHTQAQSLADRFGLTIEQTCGVIAVISPGNAWGRNLIDAETLCKAHSEGKRLPMVGTYGSRNVDKARRILNGTDPRETFTKRGPKTRAFYECILNPGSALDVCVDRHAKCLAMGIWTDRDAQSIIKTPSEYEHLASHYARLADRLGLMPHQLQAITWVTWKRLVETEGTNG